MLSSPHGAMAIPAGKKKTKWLATLTARADAWGKAQKGGAATATTKPSAATTVARLDDGNGEEDESTMEEVD